MHYGLALISQWTLVYRISFNPDPQKQAVELTFSRKRPSIDNLFIHFNSIPVKKAIEMDHRITEISL